MRMMMAAILVLGGAAPAFAQSTNLFDGSGSLAGAFYLSNLYKSAAQYGGGTGDGGGYAQPYDPGPTPEQLYQLQLIAGQLGQINGALEQYGAPSEGGDDPGYVADDGAGEDGQVYDEGYDDGGFQDGGYDGGGEGDGGDGG